MKLYLTQFPKRGEIPWYLKYFTLFIYKDKSVDIGFTVPFKVFGKWLWYLVPNWLIDRQMSKCVNYIPDYNHADGTKVKPLFGWVIDNEQGVEIHWNWWKHLKKFKLNPKMLEIENQNKINHGNKNHFCTLGCRYYSSNHSVDASGYCNMGCC